jgi:hypothetical protein
VPCTAGPAHLPAGRGHQKNLFDAIGDKHGLTLRASLAA